MTAIKRNILCMEDDTDTCTVLGLLLEANGFTVTVAQSLPRAISAVKLMEFDFILTDLHFDGQDGHIEQLRVLALTTPFAVLSGETHPEVIAGVFAAGANHYFMKPDDVMDLPSQIAKLLG